jgi:hypothetical protein
MSKDIREMIDKVKNFNQFVNENFSIVNKIVYHGTTNSTENYIPPIINFEDEVGAHFGSTIEQAENAIKRQNELSNGSDNGRVLKYQITIKNALKVPDIGRWYPNSVFDDIIEPSDLKYAKTEYYKGLGELEINNRTAEDIIKIFNDNGYDGLVYDNQYEGSGESYIVFNKQQIKPIK